MFEEVDMAELERYLISLRREFHQYPETGWTEFRTTARIIEELQKMGLSVQYGPEIHKDTLRVNVPSPDELETHWQRASAECAPAKLPERLRGGYTGCITRINGALDGPTIGIRVDIDCNELSETQDPAHIPVREGFASVHEELMHACGHDAHIAIGLGTARLLCANRHKLHGRVVLIFQPGEEGGGGAASITASGQLADIDYFWSAHVGIQSSPVGTVTAGVHDILASSKFDVCFHGKSAHAGMAPEKGRNALAAASTAALNMLAIPPHHDGFSRVNVGCLQAGSGRNIIPGEARMIAETRGETTEINDYMEKSARRICAAAAEMYECGCEFKLLCRLGSADCDPELIKRTEAILEDVEGVTGVSPDAGFEACEDVVIMMDYVQKHGGMATEMIFDMPLKAPHHNNSFDVDERVIALGARCFASLALSIAQ